MVISVALRIVIALTPSVEAQENDEWGVLPIADTYTDLNSNTPRGGEDTLEIENWTNILEQRHIKLMWLKFSLGFLPDLPKGSVITGATLQLYCLSSYEDTFSISAHSCLNNSWGESSLIYSNMPSYNATPLDSVQVKWGGSKWYSWRVLDAVLQAVNNGSNVFTVVLQPDNMMKMALPIQFISRDTTTMPWFKPLLTIYYTVDTTPPIISFLSPENKAYSVKVVPLTFTLSESTSWIGYSLDRQNNVTISGNTTLVNLPEGAHTITVYANDTAGNMGHSNMVHFTVNTLPPMIGILSPENKTYRISSVSLSFTVNEPTSWVAYRLDNKANTTLAGNTTLLGLSDGLHSLIVYAKDTAGNVGASQIVYFSINTQQKSVLPPLEWIIIIVAVIVVLGGAIGFVLHRKRKSSVKPPSMLTKLLFSLNTNA